MWVYYTKWYRINYAKLQFPTVQNTASVKAKSAEEVGHIAFSTEGNMHLAITKELKSINKEHVENNLDVVPIIDYLNNKTSKQFKASSKARRMPV